MRVFKTKWFTRFARKEGITDKKLLEAVHEAELGNIDADLGGGLIKQRVARDGGGKSGGYRTFIAYRTGDKSFFLFGFAKSDKDNLDEDELNVYKNLAKAFLLHGDTGIELMLKNGKIVEVKYR